MLTNKGKISNLYDCVQDKKAITFHLLIAANYRVNDNVETTAFNAYDLDHPSSLKS
jgi:hypothetical protein